MLLTAFPASALAFDTPAALNTTLQSATTGSIVTLGYTQASFGAEGYLNSSPNQLPVAAGNLIYSDDPETANSFGILYRDAVAAGSTRIYLYHVNGGVASAKITAVLQNKGAATANITFTHKAFPTPSTNYANVGKLAVQQYYENASLPSPLAIAPGAAALLDSSLDSTAVSTNRLVNGIYDFTSDQPLTVTALMLSSSANTLTTFGSQSFLGADGFLREGTYPNWGKENATPSSYNTSSGIKRLRIGDGAASIDPKLAGTDAETGLAATLGGNFGTTYRIRVNVTSGDGRYVAILLNPRGGAYGGYLRPTFPSSSTAFGALVPNPTTQVVNNTDGAVCAKFAPTGSAQTLLIELIPSGGSSMPIELHLVPYTNPAPVGLSVLRLD
jgi:hypothetical protein